MKPSLATFRAQMARALSGDGAFLRSRVASVLHLISGNTGNGFIMLASLAIATRALGVADFGVMVIVLTIGRVCERIVRFESWQPLVRYAAEEEARADPVRLARLYKFGLLLDISSSTIAAALTVTAAVVLADLFDFGQREIGLVMVYAIAIAINIRGMSSAALRLAGKFSTLAYISFAASLLRVALAALAYFAGAGLETFIVIWTVAQVVDVAIFNGIGFRTLARQGIPSPITVRKGKLTRDFPGFLTFAWATNASTGLRTITHEADTLLVAALTGNTAAGFYHVAKRIAKTAQQAGEMIQTVIYPDLARMWNELTTDSFRRMIVSIQILLVVIAAGTFAIVLPLGRPILQIAFGGEFGGAYPILVAHLVAVFLLLHSSPARSAILAMNRPGYALLVAFASTVLFLGVALVTIPAFGALGASFAHIAFGLLTVVMLDAAVYRQLGKAGGPAMGASKTGVEGVAAIIPRLRAARKKPDGAKP